MNDWMIDIETTGLRPDKAAILSIGAVHFDRETFEPGTAHYWSVEMLDGRAWDDATKAWWERQDGQAYAKAVTAEGRMPAGIVLTEMAALIGAEPFFWAKPAHFDYPFVEGYFAELGLKSPFSHRRVIDVRSWIASRGEDALARQSAYEAQPFTGVAHTPIDDCLNQIRMLKEACL
jgi:hypothetical protein